MPPPDPWDALAAHWPHVKVYIRYLPDGWGQTVWNGDLPFIELAHDLGRIEQRCVLAHEYQHLELGKPCSSLCGNNERDVVEATCRWLLPDLAEVGRELRKHDLGAAAMRLGVTHHVLNDRLICLTSIEETQLAELLSTGTEAEGLRAAHGPRRVTVSGHRCRLTHKGAERPGPTPLESGQDARLT